MPALQELLEQMSIAEAETFSSSGVSLCNLIKLAVNLFDKKFKNPLILGIE